MNEVKLSDYSSGSDEDYGYGQDQFLRVNTKDMKWILGSKDSDEKISSMQFPSSEQGVDDIKDSEYSENEQNEQVH